MYFETFHELWTMQGHGPYVWAGYAVGFIIITGLLMKPVLLRKKIIRNVQQQVKREASVASAKKVTQSEVK